MSSPYVNKTKLVLRMNDNVDTGENTRRIHSEEPILQIDIPNRKKKISQRRFRKKENKFRNCILII